MNTSRSHFFQAPLAPCGAVRQPVFNPSLLAADFACLKCEIRALEQAGAEVLHLDIMDGHFAPNLSIGVPVVASIRKITELPLDVHLMLTNPEDFLVPFRKAGADCLTIHIEAVPDPTRLLDQIHKLGAGAGLAVNPPTDIVVLEPYLELCDLVLTMSVMPGFGGQKFNPVALDKLSWLRKNAPDRVWRSVDGGVNESTIRSCVEAGANLLVMGTAILGHPDYRDRFEFLRDKIASRQ
jgi:ribulose-phosphate 3-epimerase